MRSDVAANAKSRWTVSQSAVQFAGCGECGLGFCFWHAGLCRGKRDCVRSVACVGSEFGRDALQQIVSIRGTKGDPQPEKWKIVVEDPQGGGVRELRVADGKIDSDDEADRDEQVPLKERRSMSHG